MRLMRILIVLILCVKSLYRALPVQSKALENIDDQLFWQAAWFSEDSKASPFTSDSKKITAKSIFITPNFVNQPVQYCPDGYRIDNGKCIKIISYQQSSDELLATRLASIITTDDTTNFDYYDSFEDDENNDDDNKNENQEDMKLPLVPILHDSGEDTESSNSINAKNITVKENDTTTDNSFITSQTFHDFRDFHIENKTDSVEIIITTLSNDGDEINSMTTYEHNQMTKHDDEDTATENPSADEFKNDENVSSSTTVSNTLFLDPATTTKSTTAITLEYENITEMNSNENETSVMQDRNDEDNQNVEPSYSLLLPMAGSLERENSTKNFTIIDGHHSMSMNSSNDDVDDILSNSTVLDYNENSQTEGAIIESSDTINFDDSSFLLNDSLIMIDYNASMPPSGNSFVDYDDVTTIDPFNVRNYDEEQTTSQESHKEATSSSDNGSLLTAAEQKASIDENQQDDLDKSSFIYETTSHYKPNNEVTSKYVYHHDVLPIEVTTSTDHPRATTTIETSTHSVKGSKLKFPDEEINNRVRFPDDDHAEQIQMQSPGIQSRLLPSAASQRFSWPRENNNNNNHRLTTNIFQFWNQQPLLNDFQRARENAKSFRSDDFFPYTRKVQIVTPQRYNYK